MFIWRKLAGASWWEQNQSLLGRHRRTLAVVERPGSKRIALEIACRTEREARQLTLELGGSIEALPPSWLEDFLREEDARPLRIGPRLIIRAGLAKHLKRDQTKHGARTIVIPAEAAFGTGHHATTAMCLRLLERVTRKFQPGWRMLDAGTGSGILALAGRCFGAGQVLAIDNDPLACATARRNARLNSVRQVTFSTGDILQQRLSGKFAIITANLFSEILIEALPAWSRHLARGGHLILSGVLRSQEAAVVRALRGHSLIASEIRRRGKWIALLAAPGRQKGS